MNYETFKKYMTLLAAITALLLLTYYIQSRPKTVTISSDKWQCEGTVAKGLDAVCTIYAVRGEKR